MCLGQTLAFCLLIVHPQNNLIDFSLEREGVFHRRTPQPRSHPRQFSQPLTCHSSLVPLSLLLPHGPPNLFVLDTCPSDSLLCLFPPHHLSSHLLTQPLEHSGSPPSCPLGPVRSPLDAQYRVSSRFSPAQSGATGSGPRLYTGGCESTRLAVEDREENSPSPPGI